MSKLPTVAIIGRPNTGKSTLFNRFVGKRRAIVSDIPGTTRDHVTERIEGDRADYLLVDTGGMGGGTNDRDFEDDVHAQSVIAIEHADVILFLVNGREDLTASDHAVVATLRRTKRQHVPVLLVITKCDDAKLTDDALPRFVGIDIAEAIIPVSALHASGLAALREGIEKALLKLHFGKSVEREEGGVPRIAIVGRPNVGKSSIVNALMSDTQRKASPLLISPIPGTTRDSTDTVIRREGKEFVLVDTAGLRRQARVEEDIEFYSVLRTLQAVEDADVTVIVLDPEQGIAKQDKHIAGLAMERGTGIILIVNKIDLLDADGKKAMRESIAEHFPFCRWAPVLFCSAQTREGLPNLFDLVTEVAEHRRVRIPTAELNRWFQKVLASPKGTQLGVRSAGSKYMTQIQSSPPAFAIFLRDARKLHLNTIRFMEGRLREKFPLEGVPIRWVKKGNEEKK